MTRNITLRLDEQVLRKARHKAVEQDQSVSQWVADLIARSVDADEQYAAARQRALKRLETGLRLGGKPLSRQEAHGR